MKKFAYLLPFLFLTGLALAQPPEKPKAEVHGKGYIPLTPEKSRALHAERFKKHGYMMRELARNATPPAEFDVKDLGWAGDAGDQAQCGSCYLYSTVKTATSSAVKAGLGKVDQFRLSPQFGMDCHDFGGCNGGNGTEVIDWMLKNGWYAEADPGQDASALYPPYEARSGRCRAPTNAKKFYPKSWAFITSDQGDHPATVEEFKTALLTFGRVNIALDAGGQFGNYNGGVITSLGRSIDHEINVRGWSDAKQAILLENQWRGWGGAKSPGDNCAWLSYKAVGALQDPFTVLFETPTPPPGPPVPPVPPPVPPGPTPPPNPSNVTLKLTQDQVASVIAQSGAVVIRGDMTLKDLMDALHKAADQPAAALDVKCCGQPNPPTRDEAEAAGKVLKEIDALKASNAELREKLVPLLKKLLEK